MRGGAGVGRHVLQRQALPPARHVVPVQALGVPRRRTTACRARRTSRVARNAVRRPRHRRGRAFVGPEPGGPAGGRHRRRGRERRGAVAAVRVARPRLPEARRRQAAGDAEPPAGLGRQHQELAGRRVDAGQRDDVGAVRDQDQVAVGRPRRRPPGARPGCAPARGARSSKTESSESQGSTRPNASCAVSRHRHQRLDRTRPTGTPRSRNAAPTRRASSRPASVRLRWVGQSPRRNPGGIPDAGRGRRVTHQHDLSAPAEERPQRLVGARGRRPEKGHGEQQSVPHLRSPSGVMAPIPFYPPYYP